MWTSVGSGQDIPYCQACPNPSDGHMEGVTHQGHTRPTPTFTPGLSGELCHCLPLCPELTPRPQRPTIHSISGQTGKRRNCLHPVPKSPHVHATLHNRVN